jgi:hypothetical protein
MIAVPKMLLDAIYGHYPRLLESVDPAYAERPETQRLREAQERARADRSRLVALMDAVEAEAPGSKAMDMSYPTFDAGYSVHFNADPVDERTTRWREVVAFISFIAPVYALQQLTTKIAPDGARLVTAAPAPDPAVAPLWSTVARNIERAFSYSRVDPDIGLLVVPDVQVQNVPIGEVTVYDALFTPTRE